MKGSAKVVLAPAESKQVNLTLDVGAFSFWSPYQGRWVAEPAASDLLIGGSAAGVELQATVRLEC